MAFPQTPLPISVEISLDGSAWTDITTDVRADDQIQITRGRSDWGQQVDAGRCSFSLGNTDGKYSPRNPESPYYGQIGRNTPVRVSVETGSVAAWLPGTTTGIDTISTPDAAALDITGDIDVRFDATLMNWYLANGAQGTGSTSVLTELIGKFNTSGDQRSWVMYTQYGYLKFSWSEDGTSGNGYVATSTVQIPVPASGRLAVRVTLDVNNGSGGWTCRFYTAENIDGGWAQLGADVTGGATTSIFASNTALQIGNGITGVGYDTALGYVHAAEVRNGIDGTLVADPDFTAQTSGATSFADSAGRTWSTGGTSEITNRKVRFVGEIASWTPEWDTGGFDVVTRVEAAGIMRRLGQGAVAAKSPMYREFVSPYRSNIVAYWPMEDGENATEFASGFDGHPAMSITGTVTPAAYSTWTASDPVPTITTGSLKANIPAYTATNYMFLRVFVAVPAAGVASTQRLLSFSTTGTASVWSLYLNTSGNLDLRAYDNEGTQILSTGFLTFAINGELKSIGVELTQDGADIDYTIFSYDITDSTMTSTSSASSTGTLTTDTFGIATQVRFGEDGLMNETAIGHLAISDNNNGFASTAGALLGWFGEVAASRVHRLGIEENFASYSVAPGDERMGVQSRSTVLELMRDAGDADEGILAEQRDILGIRLVQRTSMYNEPVLFTMDYTGSDGLVAPLDPADDDQSVTNDVTVVREGGSSSRATLASGTLSTQDPPDGIGLYDTSYTLHLHTDTQPPLHAGWKLHLGTWDETRFPQVNVDLAAAPESIDDAAALDIGCRLQITNPEVWLPPDTLDLMVQGYTETLGTFYWKITYNCTPYGPWNVAYEGGSTDGVYGRADTEGAELTEALTTTETDVDVLTTSGPVWTVAASSLITNFDFETNLTGWAGDGSTISRVATPGNAPFPGSWSLQMVPDGVAEFPNAGSSTFAATVGVSYTVSGYLRCATSRTVELNLNWFDSGVNYLSTDSVSASVTANEWVWFEGSATAPASTAFVNAAPTLSAFPPSADVVWADMITIRPTLADEEPQEFPFDVRCGGEVMAVTACTPAVTDDFSLAQTNSWGSADVGGTWSLSGGTVGGDYDVAGGVGTHTLASVDTSRRSYLTAPSGTFDIYCDIATSALATGASLTGGVMARYVDIDNLYTARLEFTTAAAIVLTIRERVASVETQLGTFTTALTHVAGTYYRVRFQGSGSALKAKVWTVGTVEPGAWQVEATDSSLSAAGSVGCRSISLTGNTNVNPTVNYDNFKLVNPQTFTVTRSGNGVVKTHSAGADVRLAHPSYTAL